MIDDILEQNEKICLSSKDIIVNNNFFNAYLTNKRVILERIPENNFYKYNLTLIKKYIGEFDQDGNPTINFFVEISNTETRNLILKFGSYNNSKNYERDQWITALDEIKSSEVAGYKNPAIQLKAEMQSGMSSKKDDFFEICPSCGNKIAGESRFCNNCGMKVNYCSKKNNIDKSLTMVSEKSTKIKPKIIKETKCTCHSCGNVSYYGKQEIWDNRTKLFDNIGKEASAASCCYCNPFINATKTKNIITDFNKCPNCGSRNIIKEEITHEI
ncbi:MAG: hypothetical protein PHV39_09015 [Methanomicrobium sp.]|nr:hypothetical protein [Methanomicrobium sp.]